MKGTEPIHRYYNGVRTAGTTICCSAVALGLLFVAPSTSQTVPPRRPVKQTHAADDKKPLALFPLTPAWTVALNNAIEAAPAYEGARGFFPIEGHRIAAYDLTGGTLLWVASVPTVRPPTAGEGLLFVVEPGAIAALRGDDGSLAWELPFAETLAAPLVWDNGWLIAASASGDIVAIRAVDGHPVWRYSLGAAPAARPALAADRVYLPTADARVVALRVETGMPLWERRLDGKPGEILALEDRLLVGAADKYFRCLRAEDGSDEWLWRMGTDTVGTAVADDETVFVVAIDNVMRALNIRNGVQRWKAALPLRPSSGPIKTGSTLLVSGVGPSVRAFNAGDGKPAGDVTTSGELAATVHLFEQRGQPLPTVVVVTRDLAKGAVITAFRRSFEPALAAVAPLPNPVPLTPPGPSQP